jgi:outer membrane protein assembly factor BamB
LRLVNRHYLGDFTHARHVAQAVLYAVNATSGALIWKYGTPGTFCPCSIETSAAVANGVVYFGADDANVYAIEAQGPAQGKLLWKYTTGNYLYASPAVANGTVYVGSSDDTFYALDAHAGTLNWSLTTGGFVNTAAVANGVVYFTSQENTFYAVDIYGDILATAVIGPTYLGSPAISDGVAYVAVHGGNVYAFSLPPNLNGNAVRLNAPPRPASLHPDLRLRVSP